jgi:large subunit ribosomal protein L6
MSRVAKKPITLGKVELNVQSDSVTVKGPKGTLSLAKPAGVAINVDNGVATLSTENAELVALTGTVRAILSNMVKGVSEGFERKLELVGVGYRAAMQGKDLSLSLGFSHPVVFVAPEGITSPPRPRPRSWSRALTSRSSVKSPPRSVRSASRSRTRARA